VSIRVVWNTICTSIRKGLINHSLFDVKKATNLLDVEPMLMEQSQDLSLQIFRDGASRHAIDSSDKQ
jgi:hypothetical protein